MAYTSWQSGAIPEGTQYYTSKQPLGDYMFYLQFDATSGTPTVVARCDYPSGIRGAGQKTFPEGTQIQQWSIEANETEASVYVTAKIAGDGGASGKLFVDGDYIGEYYATTQEHHPAYGYIQERFAPVYISGTTIASMDYFALIFGAPTAHAGGGIRAAQVSYKGKKFYGAWLAGNGEREEHLQAAFDCLFGYGDPSDVLVARFAINLGDAGGYPGGGGDWTQPGDWNSDPTTTLNLSVNGALSGRHNDPLNDTSFSYLPADNTAEAGYGCGGDGGHGGGGGAGASTIIVRQFATNKANSKEILALTKRHGYGSGGGKGGKGGDGCILIYY